MKNRKNEVTRVGKMGLNLSSSLGFVEGFAVVAAWI
jgi:hypothetical protein